MKKASTYRKPGTSIFTALELINDRVESLALIMTQMTDNPGFYARNPVTQSEIDQYFHRN